MKHLFFLGITSLFITSCQNQTSTDNSESDTTVDQVSADLDSVFQEVPDLNEHQFSALADDNPTKEHFESLLNGYYEDFEEIPFGEVDFVSSELVYGFTQFRTIETNTHVKFFFADHQDDLIAFGQKNFEEGYYGVNGGGLFLVSGEDDQSMNDVLSWFSGQE